MKDMYKHKGMKKMSYGDGDHTSESVQVPEPTVKQHGEATWPEPQNVDLRKAGK